MRTVCYRLAQEHVPWRRQSFFESRIVKSGNLPGSHDAYRASHLLSKVPLPPYFRITSMACVQKEYGLLSSFYIQDKLIPRGITGKMAF